MVYKKVLICLVMFLPCTSARADIVSGLVGWWRLDGNALDSSGKGNNGTVLGAITATDRLGRAGGAMSFDGGNDRVSTNKEPVSFSGTYDFTWSAWIRPVSVASGAAVARRALHDDYLGVSGGKVFVRRDQTGGVSGGSVPVDQWSHIVGKGDSLKLYVYLNGVLVAEGDHTTPFSGTFLNWYAGCQHDSGAGSIWFTGLIDDVRIYNRALSAADVLALYNTGGPTTINNAVLRNVEIR